MKKVPPPDLTIYPQKGVQQPSAHLTKKEKRSVIRAWKNWATIPTENPVDTWTVYIVHIIDGVPNLTAIRQIPKIA